MIATMVRILMRTLPRYLAAMGTRLRHEHRIRVTFDTLATATVAKL